MLGCVGGIGGWLDAVPIKFFEEDVISEGMFVSGMTFTSKSKCSGSYKFEGSVILLVLGVSGTSGVGIGVVDCEEIIGSGGSDVDVLCSAVGISDMGTFAEGSKVVATVDCCCWFEAPLVSCNGCGSLEMLLLEGGELLFFIRFR